MMKFRGVKYDATKKKTFFFLNSDSGPQLIFFLLRKMPKETIFLETAKFFLFQTFFSNKSGCPYFERFMRTRKNIIWFRR